MRAVLNALVRAGVEVEVEVAVESRLVAV